MIRPVLLIAALLLAPMAQAQEITEADRAAIVARTQALERAFSGAQMDMAGMMAVVPPGIWETMTEASGMSREQLLAAMDEALGEAMAEVEIVSYAMAVERGTPGVTEAGRSYLLVPTTTVLRAGGQTIQNDSATLAMEDEGQWYLVRIDDASQVTMLNAAYPDFAGVQFPRGQMSVVE